MEEVHSGHGSQILPRTFCCRNQNWSLLPLNYKGRNSSWELQDEWKGQSWIFIHSPHHIYSLCSCLVCNWKLSVADLHYILPIPQARYWEKHGFLPLTQQPSEKEAAWFKLIYTVVLCRNIWETRLALFILTSPYQFLSACYILLIFKKISSKPMTWKSDSLYNWYKMSNCSQLLIHMQCMQIKRVWWAHFCPKSLLCWKWHVCKNVILQVTCWENLWNNLLVTPLGTAGFCNSGICHKDCRPRGFQAFFHRQQKHENQESCDIVRH